MKKMFGSFAAVAVCSPLLLALAPATVGAATLVATTGPATGITQTSATLNGYLSPPSAATAYYFVYGTTSSYGQQTPEQATPAGVTTTQVQANITGLSPGTTYHFQLVAVIGLPPYVGYMAGGDQGFTTSSTGGTPGQGSNGSLKLAGTTLEVTKGKATVALWCFSSRACRGRLSIIGSRHVCVRGKAFALNAAAVRPLKANISRACRRLMRKAAKHELFGRLGATLSTGQPTLTSKVLLIPRVDFT